MSVENGEWILYGVQRNDPHCLHSSAELTALVNEIGFLPLFRNELPLFSVEERTEPLFWWSGDEARDPWEWRRVIAAAGEVAYGKFFNKKTGYISREWLPYFANARRDGYDFDARWEDEKATWRQKKIMDCVSGGEELYSFELKQRAGFGKDGEKNFEGTVTELQMQTYLCVRDFRPRVNKAGQPYGWSIAIYTPPENIFGYDCLSAAYAESPETSRERIFEHARELFPGADEKALKKLLK